MSVPKNYITVGISKNLLTPCRRIGLSRLKKTPKNINSSPVTPLPNPPVNTPQNVKVRSNISKRSLKFKETPTTEDKESINKVTVVSSNTLEVDNKPEESKKKLDSSKTSTTKKSTHINKKKSTLKDSTNEGEALNILVPVEVHHPVAKRSINFNVDEPLTTSRATSPNKEQIKVNNSGSCACVEDENSPSIHQIEEKPVAYKKRKFRLDSDDFDFSQENENLPKHTLLSIPNIPSEPRVKRRSCEVNLNDSKSGIALSKFTTEDYLKEFSSNPEQFQENLEVFTATDNEDMVAFTSLSNGFKAKKVKTEDVTNNLCLQDKNYVALLYPSLDKRNDDRKPKRSLSTKKSTLNLIGQLETVPITDQSYLKQKLTVSLERLAKEELKSKLVSDDTQLKALLPTAENLSSKTTYLDECDDELFTSSPENDKKQRANLLQLILSMEKEIKQKQEKLEKLKQAKVYRNKHSPEKIKISSVRWLEGCRTALNDLLIKMQEHGPMEMNTLTKNLRISEDILGRLQL